MLDAVPGASAGGECSRPVDLRPLRGGTDPAHVVALLAALTERVAGAAPRAGGIVLPLAADADPEAARREVAARIAASGAPVPAGVDVIVQTSGSTTGHGHLVGIGAGALVASAEATARRLAGHGQWLLALPAHHIAGIQVLVRAALAGTAPVVLDTTTGFRAEDFARAAERTAELAARAGAPSYVSLVPTQLVRVLDDAAATRALTRFAGVLVGGAATAPSALERAREAGIALVTTYGMSETGGGCVYDGVPLDGVDVRVEEGTERILLTGPMLAAGYLDDRAADTATFRTRADGTRVLATSDRGSWDGTRLRVLGRVDDVLVTGGVKVDPAAVEAALTRADAVAEACVVGVPDAEWGQAVVAVLVPGTGDTAAPGPGGVRVLGDAELAPLRELVRGRLSGAHAPRHALAVAALPTRGPGKIDRRAVAALARAALGQ